MEIVVLPMAGNIIIAHKMMFVNSITLFIQGLLKIFLGVSLYCDKGGGNFMKLEYKSYYEKFGLNVVYYRKRKRLTQLQLAEQIDVDRSHISAIELGNVGVSFDVIFKLCEVLEVKPKDLFDFRD